MRERYFQPDQEIEFEDAVYISELHPGSDDETYLRYRTDDGDEWLKNMNDLHDRKSKRVFFSNAQPSANLRSWGQYFSPSMEAKRYRRNPSGW